MHIHTVNALEVSFLTYNAVFHYTAILHPVLSESCHALYLVNESKLFQGQSYLTCTGLHPSVSGVIDTNKHSFSEESIKCTVSVLKNHSLLLSTVGEINFGT